MADKVMTVSDIDREIARLEDLKRQAKWREDQEKLIAGHSEAVEIYDRLVDDLRKLDDLGYMPPRLREALNDSTGKFNPGMYIKKPKAPKPLPSSV